MKRRDFLKKSVGAGLFAGSLITLGGYGRIFANTTNNAALPYDLVAIKDGQPEKMFDRAMEAMGGMRKFVKPNQTVVVKPNIGWDVIPEKAANTNPDLVKRIIEHCFDAGAKKVYVFDHTCDDWQKCYKNSGIEKIGLICQPNRGGLNRSGKTSYLKSFSQNTHCTFDIAHSINI